MAVKRKTGEYQDSLYGDEMVKAFVPYPLSPERLDVNYEQLEEALKSLEFLNMANNMVPAQDIFIYSFLRKEAVSTSQIEGIQSTIADLLSFESNTGDIVGSSKLDVQEVCNYLNALRSAIDDIDSPTGLPISTSLLNKAHQLLMKGHRGKNKEPGRLRRVQNCLAGGSGPRSAVFYPPPPSALPELLGDLENFIHGDSNLHPLVRTGLAHVQFETIHPYIDGNGRLGRLLIALLLKHWGMLDEPILYLSLYFKRNRAKYYRRLNDVRSMGNWEEWIDFFLCGVSEVAKEASSLAIKLNQIIVLDRKKLHGQQSVSIPAMRLFELLPQNPIIIVKQAADMLSTTQITASKAIDSLVAAEILVESTGKKKDRRFMYQSYVAALK